jgi:tetratricopeptide (TPR) repeat protein
MNADTLFERATVAVRTRKLEEARRLLFEAVKVNPRHEGAWLTLASVLTDMDQVIDCLQRVLAINADNQTAKDWLTLAQQERARQVAVAEHVADPDLGNILIEVPGDEDRPVPRLGQYLIDYKFISADQLRAALLNQRRAAETGQARRLGDILLEQGALSQERLDFALREQNRNFYSLMDE